MAHNPLIDRGLLVVVLDRLHHFPAAAILGPRQIGKTTLARMVAERVGRPVLWLDLERPSDRALLTDPYAYLPQHADKLVVIDEVQRMPEVFQALRVLIDERRRPGRFLLLGSSSPEIVRREATRLLNTMGGAPGHIFNLGHGIMPQAKIECMETLVSTVTGWRANA